MISVKSVTVKDVALRAGVSVGTVSRVLGGYANISLVNSDRVKKAIKDLGYEKCRSAEMLVARRHGSRIRSGNIGVIFVGMGQGWAIHPLFASYTMGIERACSEKGFHALVELSTDDSKLPRCVQENKVDGVLIKSTRTFPKFIDQLHGGTPLVSLGFNDPSIPIQQVSSDDRGAGWVVAEYLWKLGHRRIAFVCNDILHPMLQARLQGYESFLHSHKAHDSALIGVEEGAEVHSQPEDTPPRMDHLLDRVLKTSSPPTAIVAANDWIAHGLHSAIHRRGLRIPDDISVVGFDNEASFCNACVPALTSYAIPFHDIAYRAAMELLEQIENPNRGLAPSIHLVRGSLMERASVREIPPSA